MWRVSAQRSGNGIISDECDPDGFTILLRGPFHWNTTVHNVFPAATEGKNISLQNHSLIDFFQFAIVAIFIKFRFHRFLSPSIKAKYDVSAYQLFNTC